MECGQDSPLYYSFVVNRMGVNLALFMSPAELFHEAIGPSPSEISLPSLEPPPIDKTLIHKEQYVRTSLHLDTSTTLKWRIDNFALLTMRHNELRSPEFDGPKGTRWCCVLVLGDPRQRKAEERYVDIQLYLVHCPEDAVGYRVRAQHHIYSNDLAFNSAGPLTTETTNCTTKAADPNTVQISFSFPNNLTILFGDKCGVNGTFRLAVTLDFDIKPTDVRLDRKFSWPMNFPHYIPGMLHLNDLFFISSQDKKIPAHKAYMREVSAPLREAIDSMGNGQHFVIKQFHASSITAFVVYCYTGVLHETLIKGFGTEVLKLGHVFSIPGLILEASDYCLRNLDAEGEVRCFKIACEYGTHVQMRKVALVRIARKYAELLDGPEGLSSVLSAEQMAELQSQLRELRSCNDQML